MRQVRKVEHITGTHAQEDGENGHHVGMDTQLHPHQGKDQTDGTGEMNIEPLLGIG